MKTILIPLFIFLFLANKTSFAQNNLDKLLSKVRPGKTYALYKAKGKIKPSYIEKSTFYLKVVPPVYKTVYDTIVIAPALNGNLDTANYFVETEILELKEASVAWKTATVHSLCNEDKSSPTAALCLLKTIPDYIIINRKFFPFKNILDTTTTDYIVPKQIQIVERQILVHDTKLIRLSSDKKEELAMGEKLLKISAGKWQEWEEVICPFGKFNDPDIRDIQKALKKEAYSIKVTGSFDLQTKEILYQFQIDNRLETEGLSPETLKRLGIRREPLISIDF